jgi:hypothetical protein
MTAFAVLLSAGSVLVRLSRDGSPVCEWNYDEIQLGSKLSAVEELLGPGELVPPSEVSGITRCNRPANSNDDKFYRWQHPRIAITIFLGTKEGKVSSKYLADNNHL